MKKFTLLGFCLASLMASAQYDKEKQVVINDLDKNLSKYTDVAKEIYSKKDLK